MIEVVLNITNKKGLHARASAKFVELVDNYEAFCEVSNGAETVSGDSIMGLLMLAAAKGTSIRIKVWGKQQKELIIALQELIAKKFGEES